MRGGGYMSYESRRIHVICEEEDACYEEVCVLPYRLRGSVCHMRGGGYMSYARRRMHATRKCVCFLTGCDAR
jgi:hypothetical protein